MVLYNPTEHLCRTKSESRTRNYIVEENNERAIFLPRTEEIEKAFREYGAGH
jgi:hypothetical protein